MIRCRFSAGKPAAAMRRLHPLGSERAAAIGEAGVGFDHLLVERAEGRLAGGRLRLCGGRRSRPASPMNLPMAMIRPPRLPGVGISRAGCGNQAGRAAPLAGENSACAGQSAGRGAVTESGARFVIGQGDAAGVEAHRALSVAINRIADDRMAERGRVDAQLVGAAGFGAEFDQPCRAVDDLPVRHRAFAAPVDDHAPAGLGAGNLVERCIDGAAVVVRQAWPAPPNRPCRPGRPRTAATRAGSPWGGGRASGSPRCRDRAGAR